ncbi:hypothetical protein SDC9_04164 [bioreactor metagenome]|uniref:Uncharacterized protein n=1 Tax=bioreactor metagenome TaxID=1076179 RepID=A0A644SV99_9ZZZZ|nr:hypothetical protein [Negativicutes bacterium]
MRVESHSDISHDLDYWIQKANTMEAKYKKQYSVISTYHGDYAIFPASVPVGAACRVIYTAGNGCSQ